MMKLKISNYNNTRSKNSMTLKHHRLEMKETQLHIKPFFLTILPVNIQRVADFSIFKAKFKKYIMASHTS